MPKLAVVCLALALAASCGDSATPTPEPAPRGDSTAADGLWTLRSGHGPLGEIDPVHDHDITLEIEGGKARGSAGCNSYGGAVTIDGDDFDAGGFALSEIACPPNLAEAEERYLDAIAAVEQIGVDGDTMTLTGPGTELVFERVPPVDTKPLTGTSWILDGLIEGEAVSTATRARLLLHEDGTFEGTTGCRPFSGAWSTRGDVVEVTQMVFRGACDDGRAQDAHVAAVIAAGFRAKVQEDLLTVTSESGDLGLVYRAR